MSHDNQYNTILITLLILYLTQYTHIEYLRNVHAVYYKTVYHAICLKKINNMS